MYAAAQSKGRTLGHGSPFQLTSPRADQVLGTLSRWADLNGFERVVFWRDPEDSSKLWVQLGESRLNYWVQEASFSAGEHEQIEAQMDYARGAHRRSAAGFEKFDR